MHTRLHAALAGALAVVLLWWFLRHANLGAVLDGIRGARIDMLIGALLALLVAYVLRTWRWQCLLHPVVGPVRFRPAFRTTIIGFAALGLLPARMGDVLRPYLLARQEHLSATATFATVVLERVLDLVAVLMLLGAFAWLFSGAALIPESLLAPVRASAAAAAAVALGLLGAMWLLATHPERFGTLVQSLARVLPAKLAGTLARTATTFGGGLAATREPGMFVAALLLSIPVWLAYALESWLVTRAFGIPLPFSGTFLVQALLVVGISVPTPGGVGGFHEAYRVALTVFFGAPNDQAVAAAIFLHAMSFVPVTIAGVVFMAQDGWSVRRLKGLASESAQAQSEGSGGRDEVPVLRPSGR
ncbi:MAG: flippase-like domain-containing protein [Acidobacteria bacterium]|nr:flippase-like domain-containing protein [Acidobacteriota bacterium]